MTPNKQCPDSIEFGDPDLIDVTLVVGTQEFKPNKIILANSSKVFKEMFFGDFAEANQERFEIKDVSNDGLNSILEIIYTGKSSDFDARIPKMAYKTRYHNLESLEISGHRSKTLSPFFLGGYLNYLKTTADRFIEHKFRQFFNKEISKNVCNNDRCMYCFFFYSIVERWQQTKSFYSSPHTNRYYLAWKADVFKTRTEQPDSSSH